MNFVAIIETKLNWKRAATGNFNCISHLKMREWERETAREREREKGNSIGCMSYGEKLCRRQRAMVISWRRKCFRLQFLPLKAITRCLSYSKFMFCKIFLLSDFQNFLFSVYRIRLLDCFSRTELMSIRETMAARYLRFRILTGNMGFWKCWAFD